MAVSVLAGLLLVSACISEQQPEPAASDPPVELKAASYKRRVLTNRSAKRVVPEPESESAAEKEYVTIAGNRFEIMPPWLGNRIKQSEKTEELHLVRLPSRFTFEETKIYVTAETRDAFVKMADAALEDGVVLMVDSGFRSASFQRQIYMKQMDEGKSFEEIARWVAPPGYSEHMLGTVVDLTPSKWTFYNTDADKWLIANAGKYSFHLSYPSKTETGFAWEPWHWRYAASDSQAEKDSKAVSSPHP